MGRSVVISGVWGRRLAKSVAPTLSKEYHTHEIARYLQAGFVSCVPRKDPRTNRLR